MELIENQLVEDKRDIVYQCFAFHLLDNVCLRYPMLVVVMPIFFDKSLMLFCRNFVKHGERGLERQLMILLFILLMCNGYIILKILWRYFCVRNYFFRTSVIFL